MNGRIFMVSEPYDQLRQLADLSLGLAKQPGQHATSIPFLSILRNDRSTAFTRGILEPSMCLIAQGRKRLNISNQAFICDPGSFLVSIIDMPLKAQITDVSPKKPYIGLLVKFDPSDIATVMREANIQKKPNTQLRPGAFTGTADEGLIEIFLRLNTLAYRRDKQNYLYDLAKKELIYYILNTDFGDHFVQATILSNNKIGIGTALEWIRENFSEDYSLKHLVKLSGMSTSSFLTKFKKVTSTTPLQYQKQLRLQEARRLILSGEANATIAALEVGYTSPTQFNREYKRFYGDSPRRDTAREL